jgi:GNAT superfamily N-acetyltransferase
MPLQIEAVERGNHAALEEWYRVYFAAETWENPGALPYRLPEFVAAHWADSASIWQATFLGRDHGVPVVAGLIETPLLDNTKTAWVAVHTLPGARRRGAGTAMLAKLTQEATTRGRTLLTTEAAWPLAMEPRECPAVGFLQQHEFVIGLTDVQRRLPLPVSEQHLAELAAQAAQKHAAYRLITFWDPTPEQFVTSLAALAADIMVEAPVGELDLEPETADIAAWREKEQLRKGQGRARLTTVAIDQANNVVAYNELVTSAHEPEGLCFQWGTLVAPRHRGHRLGLAVKVANLTALQTERPDLREVTTYNADVNSHMIAINELLGFRPCGYLGEFQKRMVR